MKSLRRRVLPSESLSQHKNKLMTGKKVTELNIVNNLVEKIAELLDAEVQHSLLVDHKGTEKRKISITYKD